MNVIKKSPRGRLGYDFVPGEFLPAGADEYYLRQEQQRDGQEWRRLRADEIEVLVKNENTADDWSAIWVTERFDPDLVKRCQFFGMVRIGALEPYYLEYHDLRVPVGIYNSTIVSSDIGSNVAIDNVRYLGHYIVGDEAILLNIDEMLTTNYAKFGNGIVKVGESEGVRIRLEVINEAGGRAVVPFDGMLAGDAWLWAKHRSNKVLLDRFLKMTQERFDPRRGYYGTVGDRTIIKDCRILKDVKIGSDAYIKGANKLKNLTINSDPQERSQIGEGVELVNGIVGYGCRIFYGVKAVRFMTGTNCNLKYGARLIHSYLGDNSTVSCCEVLNALIFPGHEQHHNNSFLCAALTMGQTNMAAGVTAGSNHNSRSNDGELVAGRGWWPGLCTSLKHSSRFASFVLVAKGQYPAELDIRLPFALVSNNEAQGCLQVMPAYWFMHNMYAVARNAWKYRARDKRVHRGQELEFDALAPDTVEEIFAGMELLEEWTGKAAGGCAEIRHSKSEIRNNVQMTEMQMTEKETEGKMPSAREEELRARGRAVLADEGQWEGLEVFGEGMEKSSRPVRVFKAGPAWACYRRMVEYYGVKALAEFMAAGGYKGLEEVRGVLAGHGSREWVNLGGQLVTAREAESLVERVCSQALRTWDDVHGEYSRLAKQYMRDKAAHGLDALARLAGVEVEAVTQEQWEGWLTGAVATARWMAQATRESRAKDYENRFRQMTYDSAEEMEAVVGRLEDNEFVKEMAEEGERFAAMVERIR